MIPRNLTSEVISALADTPVVLINGARQTGKSTLVQAVAAAGFPASTGPVRYITLDDATALSAAQTDPDGFVGGLDRPVIIDEVQRAPDLFRAIKLSVDRDRRPGRFLLTGSADVLLLPNISESLAGRMEVLTLWPFSQGELEGRKERFVDALFEGEAGEVQHHVESVETNLWERVLRGGFPEAVSRTVPKRRRAWFESYITTILQRDVRDLANIEGLTAMPRLLMLMAARTSALLNYSEISRSSGLPLSTLKRYVTLLETTFLIQMLPAWSSNLSKRLVKSPKLMLCDTGLCSQLLGIGEPEIGPNSGLLGPLLENFVAMELQKQITWSERQPSLYHYRRQTGQEVDLVLEYAGGALVGVEVKASASVSRQDFKGLQALADANPRKFRRGIILYTGENTVAFGSDFHAVPIHLLWGIERVTG